MIVSGLQTKYKQARNVISSGGDDLTCDITAASLSRSDVQTAINSATNGQVVCLPAGSATWSDADVTIPNTKGIILKGAGSDGSGTNITINTSKQLIINTRAGTTGTRITAIQFLNCAGKAFEGSIQVNSTTGHPCWRIDHCAFNTNVGDTQITIGGGGPGLFDHNTVHMTNDPEFIHNRGTGSSGWNVDVIPGTADAVYIEDNDIWHDVLTGCGTGFEGSSVQNYEGARVVFRYNTVRYCNFDLHGTAGFVGARWYEIYENTWIILAIPCPGLAQCINVRAGSGVIFNNHMTIVNPGSTCAGSHNIQLIEDDSSGTWPLAYQIGSGYGGDSNGHASCSGGTLNQSPLYVWNNDSGYGTPGGDSYVNANRDFFFVASGGAQPSPMKIWQTAAQDCTSTYDYTPYTYPHPLAT